MSRTRSHLRLLVPALAALLALALAGTAQADYEQVGLFGQSGAGEQLHSTHPDAGAAVNVTGAGGVEAGSLYVAAGDRVSRYSAKGEIKEVWGPDTVESGPGQSDEVQSLSVSATSGTYTLTANTARGEAELTTGSKVLTGVTPSFGSFRVGDAISGFGIPSGTTITAVGAGTLELSAAATKTTFPYLAASETTAPIGASASAAEVKAALVALEGYEAADLTVTGGPGNAEGTNPYEVTFEGALAGLDIGQMSAVNVSLVGGIPSSSVAVKTLNSGATGFERCRPANGDVCTPPSPGGSNVQEEGVGLFFGPAGVAVDQSTGDVYVLNETNFEASHRREHNLIEVFSADGSEVIARFGDAGVYGETFDEGPAKLYYPSSTPSRIVADDTGKVYLTAESQNELRRVMCFQPESPGDYQHYVYCGRQQDIAVHINDRLGELALDDAGHVYVGSQQTFQELSLANPAAPPLCTFSTNGQAYAMTVNPLTGEVFYFNANDSKIHRLKPCDPEVGKFEEAQAPVKGSPPMIRIEALAFNPTLSWGPNRPPGVLYGADSERHITPKSQGLGYILAPAEVHSPEVLSESVSSTRTGSAVLQAEVNPNGFGTRYVFQYESEAEYEANPSGERFAGAKEAPAGAGEIGGGSIGEAIVAITGLSPDTAYRFRAIATSECNGKEGAPCTAEGEASSFATYPLFPPGLPDHRVYELVSPAQKHGGEVIPAEPGIGSCEECKPSARGTVSAMQSTPDGEALAYEGQPFTPFEGAVNYDSYVARRTASGWQSTALIPGLPPAPAIDRQVAFDTSLDHGLLNLNGASLELQDTAEPGVTTPLVSEAPPNRTGRINEFKISYGGHSADFSRQFFAANDSLTKETPFAPEPPDPGVSKKDLYEWHEGQLSVVNVLPGNETVATGAKFASVSPDTHAVSEDGSRAFFEDEAGNLYVREHGEESRQIADPGHFLSATPNGSEVLLTDGCLYSLEGESCTDLTEGKGGFKGILGQSKDLSRIYFVDGKALAAGAEAGSCTQALPGSPQAEGERAGKVPAGLGCNLYFHEAGAPPSFIATVPALEGAGVSGRLNDWASNPSARTAEASPDGRFLAFASVTPLSGYDNVGPCGVELKSEVFVTVPGPCQEAFLYDSTTGKLSCASCNPTGEAPLGNTTLRRIYTAPEEFPQPRYLTDEGRLYFDSADSLSARDTNEGVEDVYEFAPQGTGAQGTCQREAGCVFLISAGTEAVDSNLIAVDETGRNVFFDTRDKLALKDKDELLDVYDAREGGGIAAESEISRAECQGENCQTPVTPPNDPTPGSSTFEGAGNVKEAPVAKKHAKKKHAKKHKKAKKHSRTVKRNHGGAK
jgi:hypothetical protein